MSGIFGTFNVANKGLQASQTALHTTSHNISNANTEGYSRQRVDLKADLSYTLGGVGQLGSGVKMAGVSRLVDDYVSKQIRQETGALEKFSAKSETLDQLEIIYNEPSDTSLNFNLGEMFDAWSELSKNPELQTSKTIVVEKSKTMVDTLNHIANQMESLKSDTENLIGQNVRDFNLIIGQLDTLNKQIFNISVKDKVPNDLLDQRDLLLKDLSGITDFEADFSDKYGRVGISVNKTDVLTSGGLQNTLELGIDGKVTLKDSSNNEVGDLSPKSGQIAGYQDALLEIDKQMSDLDKFASTMAEAINKAHGVADIDGDGTTEDNPIFTGSSDGDITAKNIKVSNAIQKNNNLIQAGQEQGGPEGDGSRALAVANVRNQKLDFNSDGSPDNTIEGEFNGFVTKVGISKQHADNTVSNQEVLLDQLVLRRESTSGVSIDEEVTNILKFQSAFEANARVITALSEMLDVLINRMAV